MERSAAAQSAGDANTAKQKQKCKDKESGNKTIGTKKTLFDEQVWMLGGPKRAAQPAQQEENKQTSGGGKHHVGSSLVAPGSTDVATPVACSTDVA